MKRREFLLSTLASSVFAGCSGGGPGSMFTPTSSSGTSIPEGLPLRTLPTLANSAAVPGQFAATLVAQASSASLAPSRATTLWLYNGLFPGPMVEAREGDRVRIGFENRLAQDSTIHWHGLPVPPDQDGNPMDPVRPGASRVYEFTLPAGSAGTYWYHPHAHRLTAGQVSMGLAAPFLVRAANDPLAALPEVTLMVTGLEMGSDMQVMNAASDAMFAGQGATLLVNGQRRPVHAVRPGATERWRVLNATAGRYLSLQLDGHTFALVGTDGGLLGTPVTGLQEVLVAPAQRVEIVVRASSAPNARFTLRAGRHPADNLGMGAYASEDLLTLVTTGDAPVAPVPLPQVLRSIPALPSAAAAKRLVMTQSGGMGMMGGAFLLNGRTFDTDRVDFVSTAGAWESWDLVNDTFMDHPIHIHGTQFRLVSREFAGRVTPASVDGWLDTVDVPAGTTATIRVRQVIPGKRLIHCHILAHEDAGMMAVIDVPAG